MVERESAYLLVKISLSLAYIPLGLIAIMHAGVCPSPEIVLYSWITFLGKAQSEFEVVDQILHMPLEIAFGRAVHDPCTAWLAKVNCKD